MFRRFYFRNVKQLKSVNINNFRQRMASHDHENMISVNFEIHGKVQGVFFRKNTRLTAQKHGLVGWVRNTRYGTVEGKVQGKQDQVNLMKIWLKEKGSKQSIIKRADFKNEKTISELEYEDFIIRK